MADTLPLRAPADPLPANDDRLLIDVAELSRLTSLSVRTLRRMDSTGALPGALTLRRRRLFRLDAIKAWVAAGCPDNSERRGAR